MVATLWAMQNGYFDDVAVDKIKDCQAKLQEYLTTRKAGAARQDSRREGAQRRDRKPTSSRAIEDFKKSWNHR